ncbi:MAG: hypothetical protein HW390_2370 [Candidatus Brocadiaceae bacterium]|nr:hypothetical protein [Candidatus Brocadiaceae bacterium]
MKLFPDELHEYIREMLITPLEKDVDALSVDDRLLVFIQMKVAETECETNKRAYPENPHYIDLMTELGGDVQRLRDIDDFRNSLTHLMKYAEYIKNMKYLRRWNRLNRAVETSVMSHTFTVASFAVITARLEVGYAPGTLPEDFTYRAIVRALFHDVAEAFTGDVITPVKQRLKKLARKEWREIEIRRLDPFMAAAPVELQSDIRDMYLLDELHKDDEDVVGKLVKDCDRLSLLLECVFERSAGGTYGETEEAYDVYARRLLSSEFRSIREITLHGLFPRGKGRR